MPSWKDLRRFCEKDGWVLYKSTDHYFYMKQDEDGKIRKTRVSRGSNEIGPALWKLILKKQLQVTKEYFNSKI